MKCFSDFLGYVNDDLVTASGQIASEGGMNLIESWPFVRTTGYGQAVEFAAKTLFGLNSSTLQIELINKAMQAFTQDRSAQEIYEEIYKCANVKWVINDCTEDNITPITYFREDNFPAFFKSALRFGRFKIFMHHLGDRFELMMFMAIFDKFGSPECTIAPPNDLVSIRFSSNPMISRVAPDAEPTILPQTNCRRYFYLLCSVRWIQRTTNHTPTIIMPKPAIRPGSSGRSAAPSHP